MNGWRLPDPRINDHRSSEGLSLVHSTDPFSIESILHQQECSTPSLISQWKIDRGRGKSTQSSCVAKDDSSMLFLLWLSQQAGLGCSTTYFFPLITTLAIGRSGDNSAIRKSDEDNSICSSRYTFLKIGPAPAIGFLSGGAESARSGKAKLTFWGGFLWMA